MAETTTRPKPATPKKTETAGSATPDCAIDIRMIPLDQLEVSPLNVRKVAASVVCPLSDVSAHRTDLGV